MVLGKYFSSIADITYVIMNVFCCRLKAWGYFWSQDHMVVQFLTGDALHVLVGHKEDAGAALMSSS